MRRGYSFDSVLVLAAALGLGCAGSKDGDSLSSVTQTPGLAIADVSNPANQMRPGANVNVSVTKAQVITVDDFDETRNGKSRGTVYVKDYGSSAPYSGIGLFSPTFVPADLRVNAGDVLDLQGVYQENTNIGTARFPTGQVLPQLSKPISHFRFESPVPTAVKIKGPDLATYDAGRAWIGSLVTVTNASVTSAFTSDPAGRVTGKIAADGTDGLIVSNELFDLKAGTFTVGTNFGTVTGVITYFNSTSAPPGTTGLHIAPRSEADLVAK